MKNFNAPQRVRTSLVPPLHGAASLQICQVQNYTTDIPNLSILINRMTSPQNCSYRKPTTVMLTLHL